MGCAHAMARYPIGLLSSSRGVESSNELRRINKGLQQNPSRPISSTSTQYPARAYNTLRSFTLQSSRIAFLLLIILHTFIPTSALAHYAPHRLLLIQIRNPSYPHLYLYPHQNILLTEALACTSPRHHHTHLPILSYQYLVVLGWHR